MRAYRIDVTTQTVTEIDIDDELESIYKQIDARCFSIVSLNERNDTLYVDDEGLINGTIDRLGMFVITNKQTGRAIPLAGHGLIMGCNRHGNSRDAQMSLDDVQDMVSFPSVLEIRARAMSGEFD